MEQDENATLAELGRELLRLRRRTRRLHGADWGPWSEAVEQANAVSRLICRVQPRSLDDLVVRYDALHWQLVEVDDAIVDATAKRAFIAFGRALRRMTGGQASQ